MFFHIFAYRIKTLLRAKVIVFWCLVFPILLGILYYAGFGSSIDNSPSLEPIPVCVVYERESAESAAFEEVIRNVSYADGRKMFDASFVDAGKATAMLEAKEADGVITVGDDISLTFSSEGMSQSIIKQFCDTYKRKAGLISDVSRMQGADPAQVMASLSGQNTGIEQVSLGGEKVDNATQYYFALIAMACLFGSFTGMIIGDDIQVKNSAKGARKAISSTHRLKMIVADMLAAFLIDFIEVVIVSLFVNFVLGVAIIGNPVLFLPICLFGTMIGVCFGQFSSCVAGGREGLKVGLSLIFSLTSSFFAGLMAGDMKYLIDKYVPVLGRINPASLISDAFYSLTVYSDLGRYSADIAILALEAAVLVTGSFLAVRRSRHASI